MDSGSSDYDLQTANFADLGLGDLWTHARLGSTLHQSESNSAPEEDDAHDALEQRHI